MVSENRKGRQTCCSICVLSMSFLVREVLTAFQRLLGEDGVEMHSCVAGPTNGEPELVKDKLFAEVDEIIQDDVRGGALDPAQVREGQRLEMHWLNRQKVFDKVWMEQGIEEPGSWHDMTWINI